MQLETYEIEHLLTLIDEELEKSTRVTITSHKRETDCMGGRITSDSVCGPQYSPCIRLRDKLASMMEANKRYWEVTNYVHNQRTEAFKAEVNGRS